MLEGLFWLVAGIAEVVLWLRSPHHHPPRDDMRVLGDIDPPPRV